MIAQAGLLSYRMGFRTALEKSTCTQRLVFPFYESAFGEQLPNSRFRTDEVHVAWRP